MQFDSQMMMQWFGCVLGIVGSLLLALNNKRSGWGFVAYLASNAAWLTFGLATGVYALAVQHLAFTIVSAFGVWRWIVKPERDARRARESAA